MEKEFKIRTPDKKIIYGKLRGSLSKPVIISVHGLGSTMDDAIHYNAARYFEKNGFASFIFNLYDWRKGARKMLDCSLKRHGKDIDTVTKFLKRKGTKKIFILGHSYGAPAILCSEYKNYKAVVFWDGSFVEFSARFFKQDIRLRQIKARFSRWGSLTGERMVQEAFKFDTLKYLVKLNMPIKFIAAGKGILTPYEKKMYKAVKVQKALKVIAGASHNFTEGGMQEKLYKETLSWFKKFV